MNERNQRNALAAWLLFFIGAWLLSACSGDGPRAVDELMLEARQKLEQQGVAFTEAEFIQRVRLNDHYVVGLFLRAGMSPDTNTGDNSALSHAILGSNDLMVKLLINHGANPNQVLTNKKGAFTPLSVAVVKLDLSNVRYLLDHGGDVNINYDGRYLVVEGLAGAKLLTNFGGRANLPKYVVISSIIEERLEPQLFK